jgi:hypothetical protein
VASRLERGYYNTGACGYLHDSLRPSTFDDLHTKSPSLVKQKLYCNIIRRWGRDGFRIQSPNPFSRWFYIKALRPSLLEAHPTPSRILKPNSGSKGPLEAHGNGFGSCISSTPCHSHLRPSRHWTSDRPVHLGTDKYSCESAPRCDPLNRSLSVVLCRYAIGKSRAGSYVESESEDQLTEAQVCLTSLIYSLVASANPTRMSFPPLSTTPDRTHQDMRDPPAPPCSNRPPPSL